MKKIASLTRVFAMALALCLCVSFCAVALVTSADETDTITITPTTGADIVVDATNPTASLTTGSVTYDAANKKVTLSNISGLSRIVFAMSADFTVELDGANVIDTIADDRYKSSFESSATGINMTVVGGEDDSLTITTPTGSVVGDVKYEKQINVGGNLTLDGGTYTVHGHNYTVYATGDILVKDAVLSIAGQSRTMNALGKLTLTNSTVNSTVDNTTRWQLAFDNGGFEMTNSHIVTNAGGYTLAGGGNIALNSGSITSQDLVFIQTRGATENPVTVTVGTDMVLDVTCATAAISPKAGTNPVVTVSDDGVNYEEGKELVATATAVKTAAAPAPGPGGEQPGPGGEQPAPTTADAVINASVTVLGAAQSGVTVELYKDTVKVSEAATNEEGKVSFTIEDLAAGTYNYTLKQITDDASGLVYDTDKAVVVTVAADLTVTYTGNDAVFANTYAPGKIVITPTEGDAVELTDVAGDSTATVSNIGGGSISYDADKGLVVINGANVKTVEFLMNNAPVTVEVKGESSIVTKTGKCFYAEGDVTLTGDGVLLVKGYDEVVHVKGDFSVKGASTTVSGHNYVVQITGDTTVSAGNFTVDAQSATFNIAGDFNMTGGKVVSAALASYFNLRFKGDFNMTDGVLEFTRGQHGICIDGNATVSITGGTVIGKCTNMFKVHPNVTEVTLNIGTKAAIDFVCTSGINAPGGTVTVNDDGVQYESGLELTTSITGVKTVYQASSEEDNTGSNTGSNSGTTNPPTSDVNVVLYVVLAVVAMGAVAAATTFVVRRRNLN